MRSERPLERSLETTAAKWSRIARRLQRAEASRGYLRKEVKQQRREIADLKRQIRDLAPRNDTTWGWLYWPLRRNEVLAVFIGAPNSETELQTERNLIFSALRMTLNCRVSVRAFRANSGRNYFRITKGPRWAKEAVNEEASEASGSQGSSESDH